MYYYVFGFYNFRYYVSIVRLRRADAFVRSVIFDVVVRSYRIVFMCVYLETNGVPWYTLCSPWNETFIRNWKKMCWW